MDRALSPARSSHLSFCRAAGRAPEGPSMILPRFALQVGFSLKASGGILLHPIPHDTSNLGTGTTLLPRTQSLADSASPRQPGYTH